ncbi:MAG: hypothetical protein RL662_1890 [Bacteroidota bacterium]|jgi:hypothetical protein
MKKIIYSILLGLCSFILFSCTQPTIEEDAERAAELMMRSNQYNTDNNISAASETYREAQDIMNKYKRLDKFDEFYQLYIACMQDGAMVLDEDTPIETPKAIDVPGNVDRPKATGTPKNAATPVTLPTEKK